MVWANAAVKEIGVRAIRRLSTLTSVGSRDNMGRASSGHRNHGCIHRVAPSPAPWGWVFLIPMYKTVSSKPLLELETTKLRI